MKYFLYTQQIKIYCKDNLVLFPLVPPLLFIVINNHFILYIIYLTVQPYIV